MTPKEKATGLVYTFRNQNNNLECAKICVAEIINALKRDDLDNRIEEIIYWLGVKKELEKL